MTGELGQEKVKVKKQRNFGALIIQEQLRYLFQYLYLLSQINLYKDN